MCIILIIINFTLKYITLMYFEKNVIIKYNKINIKYNKNNILKSLLKRQNVYF